MRRFVVGLAHEVADNASFERDLVATPSVALMPNILLINANASQQTSVCGERVNPQPPLSTRIQKHIISFHRIQLPQHAPVRGLGRVGAAKALHAWHQNGCGARWPGIASG